MNKQENVFGLHAVQSLLQAAPDRVQQLYVLAGRDDRRIQGVVALAEQHGIAVKPVARKALDEMCAGNHQGIVAVAAAAIARDERFLFDLLARLDGPPLLLVLDGVTDPHNLGACLRTADAAGVHAVIVPKDNSAGLTETARKVACGAAETVPLVAVINLARTLKKLQQEGLWLYGTAGEAEQTLYEADMSGPAVLIMGAEGSGMRRLTREHCDYLIKIPMAGSVSSLNVSVATGVTLFEVVRQRGSGKQ
jgi:23S rRNA (guanosine2251-2'-O)-methyltransferase